ncbi:DUF1499 domain-containing protein [Crocosphaera sp. Alani8]|uniref:DUF1499 domain-containing protein n=1 Tax=Crocosphaera sp. Alani8 TaxID=3038952 RepID=UPI00313EEC2E
MIRYFFSFILVTIFSFCSLDSMAYGTELSRNSFLVDGNLLPCSSKVACVVSSQEEDKFYIAPISYHIEKNKAKEILLKVLTVVPRTQVIETKENYIIAKAKGKFLGRIDDLEFYFPPDVSIIKMRSASRSNKFDLGLNRRRLEQIRLALKELNV